ncbi:diacylglycerol/lipid kinase family protein [Pararhizobium haloflavum]|uniref:diacylglycerol/lipid kinase family protein n=1 Tax=Pararhizobium haloflavum TaxID=2037914 RepID=UPI000C196552|nr:diacylglycerol kinase family protein [Pararhizobium haloflavum]
MKIHAVLNRDGGTFRTMDLDAFCKQATEIFGRQGHDLTCEPVSGSQIKRRLEAVAGRDDVDVMLAGGGDGTISTAAGIAWKAGIPLGVVPAGTMNLFARSLKVPLDLEEALEALAGGEVMNADIGSANGRAFVHQYSLGMQARMVRLRNSFSFKSRLGKIMATTRAAAGVILNPPVFKVIIDIDGDLQERKVSAIAVSNNRYGNDSLLYADTLTEGRLGVYIAKALSPAAMAKLSADILARRFRMNENIDEIGAKRVHLYFPKLYSKARAVIDGELIPLERDVVLKLHAGELKVLAPRPAIEAEREVTETPSRKSS